MSKDFADVPFEQVAGLTISPTTDLPFGKPYQMGLAAYTIYDRAVEVGYETGIRACLECMQDHDTDTPILLDDQQFTLVLNSFMPPQTNEHNAAMWRGAFILGWASVSLGLVRVVE